MVAKFKVPLVAVIKSPAISVAKDAESTDTIFPVTNIPSPAVAVPATAAANEADTSLKSGRDNVP